MTNKKDLFIGLILGIITALVGTFLVLILLTDFRSVNDYGLIKQQGILGKVITLGTILNIGLFFILLKTGKEFIARGIILSMILLTVFTLFL